ncbi:hypothetical protein HID58_041639 [Brassica napus]|uniref:Transmembrane protein n=1 Tax=Brassica napus TaxID=3708 RepID=A0ABQ8BD10_BRANA|nr:hypothetical protein HID58_041639 [Brassica napus]
MSTSLKTKKKKTDNLYWSNLKSFITFILCLTFAPFALSPVLLFTKAVAAAASGRFTFNTSSIIQGMSLTLKQRRQSSKETLKQSLRDSKARLLSFGGRSIRLCLHGCGTQEAIFPQGFSRDGEETKC